MNADFIYLDHSATTPVRPEAREAMRPYLADRYGNSSSVHAAGRESRRALEEARSRVATCLGADPSEIVFTGSGTEADALAVLGAWRAAARSAATPSTVPGVAVSAVEHSAVRRSAGQVAREGGPVTTLAVDEAGRLDLGALDEALETPLALVSVMWANNEVGVIQPVAEVARRCRARGVPFHTDAVQAAGHLALDVDAAGCDLLALSAHKFGGPTGVGALYVREGTDLEPLIFGGSQEHGLRAGTSNVAGAVGLAAALEVAVAELDAEARRLGALRDRLEGALTDRIPDLEANGAGADRLPHVLSVGLQGVPADVLLASLDLAGLAVSSGSACQSGGSAPSPVMVAMGKRHEATLRLSLGWSTTEAEVERAADIVEEAVDGARSLAGSRT